MPAFPITPKHIRTLGEAADRITSIPLRAGDVERAVEVLRECMNATAVVRSPDVDPSTGQRIYRERPDFPIRLAAAVKVLEWQHGKPRQITDVTVNQGGKQATDPAEVVRMLAKNPDLTRQITDAMIAAAKSVTELQPDAVRPSAPPTY